MGSIASHDFPAELSKEQLDVIKSKTNMSNTEIYDWYSQFLDITRGKELTRDRFVKYYKEIINSNYNGNPDLFCQLAFNAFDLNNSDHVDFSEMVIGLTILTNPEVNERLTWMFRFFDQNKDNYIDDDELKLAVKAILKMKNVSDSDERINELAKSIKESLTKNDKISKEEFLAGAKTNSEYSDILCPHNI